MAFYSPLRYPGGKGKLAPYISSIIQSNNLTDYCYVEPYAGGAAVAIQLLLTNVVQKIIINDLDFHIYAFWYSVIYKNDSFCKMIDEIQVSVDTWYHLKRIQCIGKMKDSIEILNEDAIVLVDKLKKLNDRYIFYFDPPYFRKGYLLYENSYEEKDHLDMAVLIKSLSHPWMVTYDRGMEIQEMYDGITSQQFDISYSAHLKRPRGLEVMFYGNLDLPCCPYTSKIRQKNFI